MTRAIRSAQTQVEQQNFEIRKDVLKYDDVLNRQRKVIYGERRQVLEGADLHEQIGEMVDEVTAGYVAGETGEGYPEEWDLDKLWRAFRQLYPVSITIDDVIEDAGGDRAGLTGEFITEAIIADAQAAYERREQEFGSEVMREVERRVVLSVLDRKWREHLYEMDYLREGIGLRGYGQRDPLIEYQREGYDMFSAMMDGIKEESVGHLFNLEIQVQENPIVEEGGAAGGMPPGAPGGTPGGTGATGAGATGAGAPGAGAPGWLALLVLALLVLALLVLALLVLALLVLALLVVSLLVLSLLVLSLLVLSLLVLSLLVVVVVVVVVVLLLVVPAGPPVVGCPRRAVLAEAGPAVSRPPGPTMAGAPRVGPRRPSGTAAPAAPRRPSGTAAPAAEPMPGEPGAHPRAKPRPSRPGSPRAARSGCSTRPRPSTAERTWRPARARP